MALLKFRRGSVFTDPQISEPFYDSDNDQLLIGSGDGQYITLLKQGNNTGDVVFEGNVTASNITVEGDLVVFGSSSIVNESNLDIVGKTITVSSGSISSELSDGSGLIVDGADVSLLWDHGNGNFVFNTGVSSSIGFIGDGSGLTGVSIEYSNILNKPTLVSGSSQIIYNNISNIPDGIISSSEQLTDTSFTGSFTGSFIGDGSGLTGLNADSVEYSNVLNKPTLISGSSQLNNTSISQISITYLSASSISSSYIDFDPISNGDTPSYKNGRLFYSSEEGALSFYNEQSDISLQIGQEFYIRVFNNSGGTISNGTPVYVSGSQGDRPQIWPAFSTSSVDISHLYEFNHIIGIATHDISDSSEGYVTTAGLVRGIDTSEYSAGDILYVSESSGELTNILPENGLEKIVVGSVIRSHASSGIIYVNPKEPIHLDDITGISGSYDAIDNSLLVYDSTLGVWKPKTDDINISGSFNGTFVGDGSGLTGLGSGDVFPYTGSAIISGSLDVIGSFEVDGVYTSNDGNYYLSSSNNIVIQPQATQNTITIRGGTDTPSTKPDGGDLYLEGGDGLTDLGAGDGGSVHIIGGDSQSGTYGNVYAYARTSGLGAGKGFVSIGANSDNSIRSIVGIGKKPSQGSSFLIQSSGSWEHDSDLSVTGDVVAYASSDERYKLNIKPITNALDKVTKINGVTWKWNTLNVSKTVAGSSNIGVIAQEVQKVVPEVVHSNINGYLSVDYPKLVGVLIEAIKEQNNKIDSLLDRINNLESKINNLS